MIADRPAGIERFCGAGACIRPPEVLGRGEFKAKLGWRVTDRDQLRGNYCIFDQLCEERR
jgi:hypothetical protein